VIDYEIEELETASASSFTAARGNTVTSHPWRTRTQIQIESSQIFGGRFARPAISDQFERHLLAFVKPPQASAFYRSDVNKDVLRPVVRLDEPVAFLAVEPLHGSLRARLSPLELCRNQAGQRRSLSNPRFGRSSSV
jgi:hypothetical protein